jgi:hypothetical protein
VQKQQAELEKDKEEKEKMKNGVEHTWRATIHPILDNSLWTSNMVYVWRPGRFLNWYV